MEPKSNITCSFKVYLSNKERRHVEDPKLPTPKPKEDNKTKPIAIPKTQFLIFVGFSGGG